MPTSSAHICGNKQNSEVSPRFYSVLQVDDHTYHAIMGSRILRRDATCSFGTPSNGTSGTGTKKIHNLLFLLGFSTRYFYFYFYLCAVYVLQHTDIHVCCRYMYTTCVWYRRYTGISPPVCCTSRRYVSCSKNIPLFPQNQNLFPQLLE